MNWKTIAIIFIVITILETIFIGYVFYLGNEIIDNEDMCSYEICASYEAYYYDSIYQACECYQDNEMVYREVMR